MPYVALAALLEAHQQDLAQRLFEVVRVYHPDQAFLDQHHEQLLVRYEGCILAIATYLRDGDATLYKEFLVQFSHQVFRNRGTVEVMQICTQAIADQMKELVDLNFAELHHERIRASYKRRIDSFLTLTNVTAINARITKNPGT
jgi:hypothetical protein